MRRIPIVLCGLPLLALIGCGRKTLPVVASTPANTDSYLDLVRGGSLLIVVPRLKNAGSSAATQIVQPDSNTFLVSADNLAGYDTSYYAIKGTSRDRVQLRFAVAELTEGDRKSWDYRPPPLPFALPLTDQHVRLIYFIRQSKSDHNMAIAASKNLNTLNTFTKQFQARPDICKPDGEIFCSWVPSGVAVRPESQLPPKPQ